MKLVATRLVNVPTDAKNEVEVELVVVELAPVKFWRVVEPFTCKLARVARPEVTKVERFVLPDTARTLVLKVVEVEFVVVEFAPTKFWRVVEPFTRRVESVAAPAESEPPIVAFPDAASTPVAKVVAVAFDEVEFPAVKFWRVEEPFTWRLARVARPEVMRELREVAPDTARTLVAKVVEVEFVVVEFAPTKFWRVVEPVARRLAKVATPLDDKVLKEALPDTASTFAANAVEVLLVVVEFLPVKFWRVVEPVKARFCAATRPMTLSPPLKREFPETASVAEGTVVPMPKRPAASITEVRMPVLLYMSTVLAVAPLAGKSTKVVVAASSEEIDSFP